MTWIAYSALMFVASVAMYLTIRKATLVGIPNALTNLATFAIPFIAYLGLSLTRPPQFAFTLTNTIILIVAGVIFSYGASALSMRAIAAAPNPGYSLVISKNYVLFTTLIAVLLLHSPLSTRQAAAIAAIVAFSALIMINRSQNHAAPIRSTWLWQSIGAFFGWGMLSLSAKYLFTHGMDTIAFLVCLFGICASCIVVINHIRWRTIVALTKRDRILLLSLGLFATLFNIGNFEAIHRAPNIGYVNAINAGSIALVSVFAVIIFKDELTKRKAVGIFGVTIGLILLLI